MRRLLYDLIFWSKKWVQIFLQVLKQVLVCIYDGWQREMKKNAIDIFLLSDYLLADGINKMAVDSLKSYVAHFENLETFASFLKILNFQATHRRDILGDLFGGSHAAESRRVVEGVRGVCIDAEHADLVHVDEEGGRQGNQEEQEKRHD